LTELTETEQLECITWLQLSVKPSAVISATTHECSHTTLCTVQVTPPSTVHTHAHATTNKYTIHIQHLFNRLLIMTLRYHWQ